MSLEEQVDKQAKQPLQLSAEQLQQLVFRRERYLDVILSVLRSRAALSLKQALAGSSPLTEGQMGAFTSFTLQIYQIMHDTLTKEYDNALKLGVPHKIDSAMQNALQEVAKRYERFKPDSHLQEDTRLSQAVQATLATLIHHARTLNAHNLDAQELQLLEDTENTDIPSLNDPTAFVTVQAPEPEPISEEEPLPTLTFHPPESLNWDTFLTQHKYLLPSATQAEDNTSSSSTPTPETTQRPTVEELFPDLNCVYHDIHFCDPDNFRKLDLNSPVEGERDGRVSHTQLLKLDNDKLIADFQVKPAVLENVVAQAFRSIGSSGKLQRAILKKSLSTFEKKIRTISSFSCVLRGRADQESKMTIFFGSKPLLTADEFDVHVRKYFSKIDSRVERKIFDPIRVAFTTLKERSADDGLWPITSSAQYNAFINECITCARHTFFETVRSQDFNYYKYFLKNPVLCEFIWSILYMRDSVWQFYDLNDENDSWEQDIDRRSLNDIFWDWMDKIRPPSFSSKQDSTLVSEENLSEQGELITYTPDRLRELKKSIREMRKRVLRNNPNCIRPPVNMPIRDYIESTRNILFITQDEHDQIECDPTATATQVVILHPDNDENIHPKSLFNAVRADSFVLPALRSIPMRDPWLDIYTFCSIVYGAHFSEDPTQNNARKVASSVAIKLVDELQPAVLTAMIAKRECFNDTELQRLLLTSDTVLLDELRTYDQMVTSDPPLNVHEATFRMLVLFYMLQFAESAGIYIEGGQKKLEKFSIRLGMDDKSKNPYVAMQKLAKQYMQQFATQSAPKKLLEVNEDVAVAPETQEVSVLHRPLLQERFDKSVLLHGVHKIDPVTLRNTVVSTLVRNGFDQELASNDVAQQMIDMCTKKQGICMPEFFYHPRLLAELEGDKKALWKKCAKILPNPLQGAAQSVHGLWSVDMPIDERKRFVFLMQDGASLTSDYVNDLCDWCIHSSMFADISDKQRQFDVFRKKGVVVEENSFAFLRADLFRKIILTKDSTATHLPSEITSHRQWDEYMDSLHQEIVQIIAKFHNEDEAQYDWQRIVSSYCPFAHFVMSFERIRHAMHCLFSFPDKESHTTPHTPHDIFYWYLDALGGEPEDSPFHPDRWTPSHDSPPALQEQPPSHPLLHVPILLEWWNSVRDASISALHISDHPKKRQTKTVCTRTLTHFFHDTEKDFQKAAGGRDTIQTGRAITNMGNRIVTKLQELPLTIPLNGDGDISLPSELPLYIHAQLTHLIGKLTQDTQLTDLTSPPPLSSPTPDSAQPTTTSETPSSSPTHDTPADSSPTHPDSPPSPSTDDTDTSQETETTPSIQSRRPWRTQPPSSPSSSTPSSSSAANTSSPSPQLDYQEVTAQLNPHLSELQRLVQAMIQHEQQLIQHIKDLHTQRATLHEKIANDPSASELNDLQQELQRVQAEIQEKEGELLAVRAKSEKNNGPLCFAIECLSFDLSTS